MFDRNKPTALLRYKIGLVPAVLIVSLILFIIELFEMFPMKPKGPIAWIILYILAIPLTIGMEIGAEFALHNRFTDKLGRIGKVTYQVTLFVGVVALLLYSSPWLNAHLSPYIDSW